VRHVELHNRNILNENGHPIASFYASYISSYYNFEKGYLALDEDPIKKFQLKEKLLYKV
jgi:hypothetical protein